MILVKFTLGAESGDAKAVAKYFTIFGHDEVEAQGFIIKLEQLVSQGSAQPMHREGCPSAHVLVTHSDPSHVIFISEALEPKMFFTTIVALVAQVNDWLSRVVPSTMEKLKACTFLLTSNNCACPTPLVNQELQPP